MDSERVEMPVEIYETGDDFRTQTDSNTNRQQPLQCSGSEHVRNRSHRSVLLCLVLLCALLTVIVLFVRINRNNHRRHIKSKILLEEKDQLLTKYTNITEERDQLLTKHINITEERDQLLTKHINLSKEKKQLLTKYINLSKEKKQLLTKYTNITEERDQLLTKYINLSKEKKQLLTKYTNITEETAELRVKYNNVTKLSEQQNQEKNELWAHLHDGWIYYEFSLYFISSEKKNWTESRRYCRVRGADLIIINNKEEQEFVLNVTGGEEAWIGLSDSDEEGRWEWVDGSTLTYSFWGLREPNGGTRENCVESYRSGWNDNSCNKIKKWICERNIF
ncbi:CD209 antigen-like protein B isoform X1 [Triplophysa rosa]|uniref:CD209 antigen-like protein B isoform X1 n=1 Tax=Triplophysa rosa TaxID=992332 RepID=UPI002545D51F|nr:CD209 antigen-like protein B isoform X1 [Triplophysa rosa]